MTAPTYQPGDRVYRWVWVGGEEHQPQPLTVVRLNQTTITVETDEGARLRVRPWDLEGRWNE